MPRTQITGDAIGDGTVKRTDLDAVTAGAAVIRKVITTAGSNISLAATGPDAGTGDVTFNLTFKLTVSTTAPAGPATNDLWVDIT